MCDPPRVSAKIGLSPFFWVASSKKGLGHKCGAVVLIEVATEVRVVATADVVRGIALPVLLIDGVSAIVRVLGRCAPGL